jgi:hypothetical protein
MGAFGLTAAGEFSNAVTDCGLWLNGVNLGTRYEGTYPGSSNAIGSCSVWTDWTQYNSQMKADIQNFALASMDALQVNRIFSSLVLFPNIFSELLLLDLEDWKLKCLRHG